jgi:hypothetical protein
MLINPRCSGKNPQHLFLYMDQNYTLERLHLEDFYGGFFLKKKIIGFVKKKYFLLVCAT